MSKIWVGIVALCFMATVGCCQESKQLRSFKEDFNKEKEAKLAWEDFASYLRAEAKYWHTNNYIGKDVLFEGFVVGRKGNLLQIRNGDRIHGPMPLDIFVDPPDNIDQYFRSDTTCVSISGSITSISESRQIFVKVKRIVIVASQ